MPSPNGVADADVEALFAQADRFVPRALGRLMTLIEEGYELDANAFLGHRGTASIVGITGPPGAGKSTLTSRLIEIWRAESQVVGVLAVDPSSPFSGGALLGDRVRLQQHALDRGVFIRSMATRGRLGGLCSAAPVAAEVLSRLVDRVLIETVGVGQVELQVAETADTVVLVLAPGWGDSVQADKAGILEIADVFVVNKSDRPGADQCRADLKSLLSVAPAKKDGWRPPVLTASAAGNVGCTEIVAAIESHQTHLATTSTGEERRGRRARSQVRAQVLHLIEARLDELLGDGACPAVYESTVAAAGRLSLQLGSYLRGEEPAG